MWIAIKNKMSLLQIASRDLYPTKNETMAPLHVAIKTVLKSYL